MKLVQLIKICGHQILTRSVDIELDLYGRLIDWSSQKKPSFVRFRMKKLAMTTKIIIKMINKSNLAFSLFMLQQQ